MTVATMTLHSIVESGVDVFNFKYPFPKGRREEFEDKFIDYYLLHEIGFETIDAFRARLRSKLNTIMPYYMQLFETEGIIDAPLDAYSLTETYRRSAEDRLSSRGTNDVSGRSGKRDRHSSDEQMSFDMTEDYVADGTSEGSLGRETTTEGKKTFAEIMTDVIGKTRDLTRNITVTITEDETTNVDDSIVVTFTENQRSQGSMIGVKGQVYHEDNQLVENKFFSDTPQTNFVIGDSTPAGDPISSYATTLEKDTKVGSKDGSVNDQMSEDTTSERLTDNTTTTTRGTETKRDLTHEEHGLVTENEIESIDERRETNNETNTRDVFNQADTTKGATWEKRETVHHEDKHTKTSEQTASETDSHTLSANEAQSNALRETEWQRDTHGRKMQSPAALLEAYRRTLLNIDLRIIKDCESLFLGVY